MLEKTVESLQSLPGEVRELSRRVGQVESQVLQLRTEMRGEISAIRRDMATKADLASELKIYATKEDLKAYATKDCRRHTTVLFEDLIRRLTITREGDPTSQ